MCTVMTRKWIMPNRRALHQSHATNYSHQLHWCWLQVGTGLDKSVGDGQRWTDIALRANLFQDRLSRWLVSDGTLAKVKNNDYLMNTQSSMNSQASSLLLQSPITYNRLCVSYSHHLLVNWQMTPASNVLSIIFKAYGWNWLQVTSAVVTLKQG